MLHLQFCCPDAIAALSLLPKLSVDAMPSFFLLIIGHVHTLAISVQFRLSLWSRLAACYHPSPSAGQRRSAGLLPASTASWTAAEMLLAPPLQSLPLFLPVPLAISRSGFPSDAYMSITFAACSWLYQDVQWAGTKLWASLCCWAKTPMPGCMGLAMINSACQSAACNVRSTAEHE